MPFEELTDQLATSTTRRTVVKTGAKLAYAAPLVAATMKLSAAGVGAASPPNDTPPDTCPVFTSPTPTCWWLSNITNCWEDNHNGAGTQQACQALDTCSAGGGGASGGGCYKWALSTVGAVIAPPW